jgi:hypothetical protein
MTQQIPDPDTLEFALNLLACEGRDGHAADSPVVFRVTEKLRRPLSRLAGTAGFRSLLSRALTLARVQAPSLSVVQINPDGSLDGLDPLGDPDEASNAGAMLVAQLLALLTLFIGNNLVLSLVSDIWPELESQNRELRSMDEYDPK